MNVLAELQRRGYQVQMCPGKVEVISNLEMRRRAIEEEVSIWDQLNDDLQLIMDSEIQARLEVKDQA